MIERVRCVWGNEWSRDSSQLLWNKQLQYIHQNSVWSKMLFSPAGLPDLCDDLSRHSQSLPNLLPLWQVQGHSSQLTHRERVGLRDSTALKSWEEMHNDSVTANTTTRLTSTKLITSSFLPQVCAHPLTSRIQHESLL